MLFYLTKVRCSFNHTKSPLNPTTSEGRELEGQRGKLEEQGGEEGHCCHQSCANLISFPLKDSPTNHIFCQTAEAGGCTPGLTGGLLPPSCYSRHVLQLAHGRIESCPRSAGLQPPLHLAGSAAGTTTHALTGHRNPSPAHNSLSCQEHSSSSTGYVSLDKCYFCTCTCTRLRGIMGFN